MTDPAWAQRVCLYCGKDVNPNAPGTFRKVIGWAEVRTGGGIHGLTDREELGEYACFGCIKLKRMGVNPDQESML